MDAQRKVLLKYGGREILAVLPPPGSAADLHAIKELAKSKFDALADNNTSDIVIQTYDSDFKRLVDLSHPFTVTSNQEFQVVLLDQKGSGKVRINPWHDLCPIRNEHFWARCVHRHRRVYGMCCKACIRI